MGGAPVWIPEENVPAPGPGAVGAPTACSDGGEHGGCGGTGTVVGQVEGHVWAPGRFRSAAGT